MRAHEREMPDFCLVPAMVCLHVPRVGETREHDCVVCLQDSKQGEKLRMMPCSHSFHQRCIFDCLLVNRLCPVSRFALPSADEQRLLDEQAAAAQAGSAGSNC